VAAAVAAEPVGAIRRILPATPVLRIMVLEGATVALLLLVVGLVVLAQRLALE
jgi:hypothetical protein